MTKCVRVENADTAEYKVLVQVWDKGQDGQPDKLDREILLANPTEMTDASVYLTSTRYLIVMEA